MTASPSAHPYRDELRALLRLATPVAFVQLGLMGMGAVDVMMVGRVTPIEMAAVGLGNVFTTGLLVPLQGVLMALDPLVSQAYGAANRDRVSLAMKRGAVLSVLLSVPCYFLLSSVEPAMRLIGQQPAVVPTAAAYSHAISVSSPAFLFFIVLRHTLQGMSIVRPVLVAVVLANVANVFLNLGFVYGRFGLPAMGAEGTGWASTCARYLLVLFTAGLTWPSLRPFWQRSVQGVLRVRPLLRLLRVGTAIGLQIGLEIWGFVAVALMIGNMGHVELTGHQVAITLAAISFMVPIAIGGAAATRCGNAIGRGDPEGARRAAFMSLALGASVMLVSAAAFLIAPRLLARAFSPEAEVIAAAAALLPIAGIFQVFDGTQAVGCGVLRGAADTRFAALSNLVGYWVVGIPFGWCLTRYLGFGPRGLWWGLTLGLFVVAVLLVQRIVRRFGGLRGDSYHLVALEHE